MKTFLKISIVVLFITLLTTACDTNPSLQKYIVDSKENNEFISIDLPSSILKLKDGDVSEDVKNTLETIKKALNQEIPATISIPHNDTSIDAEEHCKKNCI